MFEEEIKKVEKELKKNKNVLAAYVFGSLAKGNANENSDVDIGVILKDASIKKEAGGGVVILGQSRYCSTEYL